MKLKHVGNGAVVHGPSGKVYEAGAGEVVNFLAEDAKALADHPEWSVDVVETDAEVSEEEGE